MRADALCRVRVERNVLLLCSRENKKCCGPIDKQAGGPVTARQTAPEWDRVMRDREVGLDDDHRFVAISGAAPR